MKWIPLRMNYLPLIFQEINFVTEEYLTLLNKIRKHKNKNDNKNNSKNKIKVEEDEEEDEEEGKVSNVDKENEDDNIEKTIKKYNGLRESISKRINDLEEFYEDNIEDVRVSNFEKARLRLKKLLMYSYENINRIENSSQKKNIFVKETSMYNKKLTNEDKKKLVENNLPLEKQIEKEKIKEQEKVKQKMVEPRKKTKEQATKKFTGNENYLKPLNKNENKRNSFNKWGKIDDSSSFDNYDYSKCKEIIFKIKLTPEEYKILLKEKKNGGKLSPYLFK